MANDEKDVFFYGEHDSRNMGPEKSRDLGTFFRKKFLSTMLSENSTLTLNF